MIANESCNFAEAFTKGDCEDMIRRVLFVVVLAVLLISLLGCQTIAGMGRDVTGASEAVEGWITHP
jgi:predicted small secreted protein